MGTFKSQGGKSMQTQNYEEAKRYFLNNAQHGWKYIEAFIISEKMLERLLQEDLPGGSAKRKQTSIIDPGTSIHIKGYPIIMSREFNLPFGIKTIKFELYRDKSTSLL